MSRLRTYTRVYTRAACVRGAHGGGAGRACGTGEPPWHPGCASSCLLGPCRPCPPGIGSGRGSAPRLPQGVCARPPPPFPASSEGRSCPWSAGLCLCHSHIPFRALADLRPPQSTPPHTPRRTPVHTHTTEAREGQSASPSRRCPSGLRAPLSRPALPGEPAPPIQSAWGRGSGKLRGRRGSSPPFRPSNIVAAPDLCSFM